MEHLFFLFSFLTIGDRPCSAPQRVSAIAKKPSIVVSIVSRHLVGDLGREGWRIFVQTFVALWSGSELFTFAHKRRGWGGLNRQFHIQG